MSLNGLERPSEDRRAVLAEVNRAGPNSSGWALPLVIATSGHFFASCCNVSWVACGTSIWLRHLAKYIIAASRRQWPPACDNPASRMALCYRAMAPAGNKCDQGTGSASRTACRIRCRRRFETNATGDNFA